MAGTLPVTAERLTVTGRPLEGIKNEIKVPTKKNWVLYYST